MTNPLEDSEAAGLCPFAQLVVLDLSGTVATSSIALTLTPSAMLSDLDPDACGCRT